MTNKEIESFLGQGLELMGLSLDRQPEALSRLVSYFRELLKWNSKVNLVARTLDEKQILENHFLDSLTLINLLPQYDLAQKNLLDVGTGAGFPGLVIKTVCPALSVTLVEPRRNRYFFLKHIIRSLRLQDIELYDVRLTENKKVKELADRQFSWITSRAFTDTRHFAELAAPYLAENGRIVLMKGPGAAAELADLGSQRTIGRFVVDESKRLLLPFSKAERWLVSLKADVEK